MKSNRNLSGARLFFIEFLIVLFFFLIISTVCLRLFTRAHLITQNANACSQSQALATSITEALDGMDISQAEANETYLKVLCELYPDAKSDKDRLLLFFDSDFNSCSGEQAVYTAQIMAFSEDAVLSTLQLSVTDRKGQSIYDFSVTLHRQLSLREVTA